MELILEPASAFDDEAANRILTNFRVAQESHAGLPIARESSDRSHISRVTNRNVYLLGALNRRVSIAAQQTRATNLALAIQRRSVVDGTNIERVGVIGSGAAGMTCAFSLAMLGVDAVVFGDSPEPFNRQRDSAARPVWPHIAEWPGYRSYAPWNASRLSTPCFAWHGGTPETIVASWDLELTSRATNDSLDHFEFPDRGTVELINDCGHVQLRCDTESHVEVVPSVSRPGATLSQKFDALVLAIGHGDETFADAGEVAKVLRAYWDRDIGDKPCDQVRPDQKAARAPWLVSGRGDGGILELLRVALREYIDWGHVLDILAREEYRRPAFGRKARKIENRVSDEYGAAKIDGYYEEDYHNDLFVPELYDYLNGRGPLTGNHTARLVIREPDVYSPAAAPLSRLLLFHLRMLNAVIVERGVEVLFDKPAKPCEHYRISFQKKIRAAKHPRIRRFNSKGSHTASHDGGFVIRHGPDEPAIERITNLKDQTMHLKLNAASEDLTTPSVDRVPQWDLARFERYD